MRVTVIIPTYNRAGLIEETVHSVLAQSYADFEVLIVDDGSTDHTQAVVSAAFSEEPRVRYHLQQNAGAQAARNKGTELASGEYVMYLDSDDLLHPEFLAKQMESFALDHQLDGSIAQTAWFMQKPGDGPFVWNRVVLHDPLTSFLEQDVLWSTLGGVWRKEFIQKMGGWRLEVKSSQDVDFHLRAAYHGHRVRFIPEVLVYARDHAGPRISGGSRPGWIRDVVEITDYIYGEMRKDGRLTPRHTHIIASNYLWCARKQARDSTLPDALGYLKKCLEVQPSVARRIGIALLAPVGLRIMNRLKQWYYISYGIHLLLGLEVKRFNWHKHYRLENWLQHSDFTKA